MKSYFSAALLLLSASAFCASLPENLLSNGGFDAGMSRWKGEGKIASVKTPAPEKTSILDQPKASEEKFLEIDLCSHSQKISQHFLVPRDVRILKLTFKVKTSPDFATDRPTLGALTLRFRRLNGGFTYHDLPVPVHADWREMEWTYSIEAESKSLDIEIEVLPGKGEIFFDEFAVQPLRG